MITVGDALLKLGIDDSDLDKSMKGLGGKLTSGLGTVAKGVGIGLAAVGTAAVGVGIASVKMAADFEGGMREVNSMMGLSEEEFQKLQNDVISLSKETGKSSSELAGALYQIVSAGVPASEALGVLKTSAIGAVAGVTDVETAADGLTTIMNAFKLPAADASKILDVMFTTVKGGKTTMEELSGAMFNVAPLAAAAGVSFEEVAGAIATVTKQGVPTSVATTELRAAIQAIIKPTADMSTALEALGYASGDALLAEKGFAGTLNTLVSAAGGSNEALGKMFGYVEGLQAVLSLTGDNAKVFESDLSNAMNSAGAATGAYDEINKGAARQFELLTNKVQGLMAELGLKFLPLLTPLIDGILKLIDALPIDEITELITGLLPPLIEMLLKLMKAIPIDVVIKFVKAALIPMMDILEALLPILEPVLLIFGKLLELLTPVLNILGQVLTFVARILGSGITSVLSGITTLFGGEATEFKIPSFEMPSFAGFEGIIPGIPGTPISAIVHAGEYLGQGNRGTVINNYFSMPGMIVRKEADINRIAQELYRMQQLRSRSSGM
ncbi:MAG: phage tail tape measure protein [Dehalococcoidia bacterium]